jgi:hypothetical protein
MQEILRAIGDEPGIHGLRIMDKGGRVIFAADTAELHTRLTKRDEVCLACHVGDSTRQGPYGAADTYDIQTRTDGERTLRLVTPILNEPSCYNSAATGSFGRIAREHEVDWNSSDKSLGPVEKVQFLLSFDGSNLDVRRLLITAASIDVLDEGR